MQSLIITEKDFNGKESSPPLKNIKINLSDIINKGKKTLQKAGVNPAEREVIWLMEFILGKKIIDFEIQISEKQKNEFLKLINKRVKHYPLQYLIGNIDFFDTKICVTNNVLIPRPETEEMVEKACNLLKNIPGEIICADLGTGSGCISIAIAKKIKKTKWFACDASETALQVAKSNAERNFISDKIKFFYGNWFYAFPKNIKFDFIIANPPYVKEWEKLQPELSYEPSNALFSGKDGLNAYREIISNLREKMNSGGVFLGEFGLGQSAELIKISKKNKFDKIEIIKDLSGRERFIKIF